tara:strand:- start:112 stop:543 length:432 start_codon:yes stop_codon:yes gene_type:complete
MVDKFKYTNLYIIMIYNKFNPIYSNETYMPEAVLCNWITLSMMGITSAMVFYHISRSNTLKTDKRLSALITITLLLVGVCFVVISAKNYSNRIIRILNICKADSKCTDVRYDDIRSSFRDNIILTILLIIIELFIGYLVFNTL